VSRGPIHVAALAALALAGAGCPGRPKAVVYDLAARAPVAETWAGSDVVRFGTPAAEPRLTDGFHREAGGAEEPFLWSKGEAEVAFQWTDAVPRVAILDAAPYRGLREQAVEVRLNGTAVERFRLNDVRQRYRIALPAAAQRPGDNRVRFVFTATPTRRASTGDSWPRPSTPSSPARRPTPRSRTCWGATPRGRSRSARRRASRASPCSGLR
jgi:hypothetical protein